MFDLSRLGEWRDLPFFEQDLPGVEKALRARGMSFSPPAHLVFSALEQTQPSECKVVILGQDPYPAKGKATGLAFSIPQGFERKGHDSFTNIFAELQRSGVSRTSTDITDWAREGVLLLNALALTVYTKPEDCKNLGWGRLITQVFDHLAPGPRAYLFWGRKPFVKKLASRVDKTQNLVIETSHPSPLGHAKSGPGYGAFSGSNCFAHTNDWLRNCRQTPINWGDPESDK